MQNVPEKVNRLLHPEVLTTGSQELAMSQMLHAFLRQLDTEVIFLEKEKLTDEMIAQTRASYNDNIDFYGYMYEMRPDMVSRTRKNYLNRFIQEIKTTSRSGGILVVGSGNGRDTVLLGREGFHIVAVDSAQAMSEATKAWGNGFVNIIQKDIRDVNFFVEKNFCGVLAESALEHLNHEDVYDLVDRFTTWLEDDGVLLIRLKISDSGKVYMVSDGVGVRFFTSWTRDQIGALTDYLSKSYDEIVEWQVPHSDVDEAKDSDGSQLEHINKPDFYTILAKKTI